MLESVITLRRRAAQCRRLADAMGCQTSPSIALLYEMAGEFDSQADEAEGTGSPPQSRLLDLTVYPVTENDTRSIRRLGR